MSNEREISGGYSRTFGPDSLESRAIHEARLNSLALYRDAQLLFNAQRWGPSVSFSILACEEVGKFVLYYHQLGTPFSEIRAAREHRQKQAKFSDQLRSCLRVRALDDYFREHGECDKKARLLAGLLYLQKCEIVARNNPDDPHAVSSNPETGPIFGEIASRVTRDIAFRVAEQASNGELNAIKQRGLYVDVIGDVLYSPNDFTQQEAQIHLRAAELVLDIVAPECQQQHHPVPSRREE